jgi:hypothetical protein
VGYIATASNTTIKGYVIEIGTTDVIVQQNNEGSMISGKSANTYKKGDTTVNKNGRFKILHAPMVPIGINVIAKAKITTPKSKGEPGKGGGKNIQ